MNNEIRFRFKGDFCVYCGQHAQSDEHFPPDSWGRRGFLFPCCKECNNFASTKYPTNFVKRVAYVKEKIAKKHKKALDLPVWTQDDLDELEGNLKRSVGLWQKKKRVAQARLVWDAIAYIKFIAPNKDFVQMLAEFGITTNSDV
jgi:hypothetical protein